MNTVMYVLWGITFVYLTILFKYENKLSWSQREFLSGLGGIITGITCVITYVYYGGT